MSGEYIWSESGLRLLSLFHHEISKVGNQRLTSLAIEREWGLLNPKTAGNKRIWSRTDESYLIENFVNTSVSELATALNRTETAIWSKYHTLINAIADKKIADKLLIK